MSKHPLDACSMEETSDAGGFYLVDPKCSLHDSKIQPYDLQIILTNTISMNIKQYRKSSDFKGGNMQAKYSRVRKFG